MNLDPRRPPARLGDRTVDWGRLVLEREGSASVKLTPKAAQVLALLIDAGGETVARTRIFDAVWPGSASSDEVLTQVVKELRRAFGERAGEASSIETIPKLGYRWAGPMPDAPAPRRADPPSPPRASRARWVVAAASLAVAALATAYALRDTPTIATSLPAPPQRITAEPGADLDPALDPDGTTLAYVHRDATHGELRVRALGATQHRALVLPAGGVPSAPAWSPDGRSLAYLWHAGGGCEVHRIALEDDASPQRIADGCPATLPSSLDWLPDDTLVFSREVAAADTPAGRQVALYRVAAGGGTPVRVTHASARVATDVHPRAAPDGRVIAFVRDGDGPNRVVVVGADGRESDVPLPFWPYRVAWSRDALVIAGHGTTPGEIWRLSDDGTLDVLARDAGPGFAVARDGDRIVYEEHRADDNVWRIPLDGSAKPAQLTHATRGERAPRVSPDGAAVAYLGDEGGATEVYLVTLADDARRRVSSFAPHVPLDLRWSPDGSRLAVIVGTEHGKRLALIGRDGTRVALPAAVAALPIEQLEFAPDGRALYLAVVAAGHRELHRVPYPALDAPLPVADFTIAAFAIDRADGALYVARPRAAHLERYDVASQALVDTGIALTAAPSDQWLVDAGRFMTLRQTDRGDVAELHLERLDGEPLGDWTMRAPTPFLGRDFELTGETLVVARRDASETDLVALPLAPPGDAREARRDGDSQ